MEERASKKTLALPQKTSGKTVAHWKASKKDNPEDVIPMGDGAFKDF